MGNGLLNKVGIPRLIISLFLAFLVAAAFSFGLPMGQIFSAMLTRFGMNALLVLAMIPTTQAGAGPNFGLPFGIICGLVGATLAIELDLRGFTALFFAIGVSIPLGAAAGYVCVLVLAPYINSAGVVGLYTRPGAIWFSCVLLLYWLSRVWLKAHRGEMHEDPVVFALKDKVSLAVGGLVLVSMLVAL